MSIDRVLCATDLSLEESTAWRSAARLVQALDASVRILHVIQPVTFPYPAEGPGRDELREKLRAELLSEARMVVQTRLASLEREWAEGYRADRIEAVTAREGIAAQMILLEAERTAAGMILVFTRRRNPLRRWLHPSVAQQVVSSARIPVVVLPIADAEPSATATVIEAGG
ncbi:MAG: universal stress protein [Vicinamibacterales bacterium]